MSTGLHWAAALATIALLMGYELALAFAQRKSPARMARTAHAALREQWFDAVSRQAGSELLAVQTLRNSLMSATLTASTSALCLMGSISLTAPGLAAGLAAADHGDALQPRTLLTLVLIALLFASLVSSAMAVRYFNHASFIAAMTVGSPERARWLDAGRQYLVRAGLLYGWGLRNLILVSPIVASLLHPAAGPIAALAVVITLMSFDRVGGR